MSLNEFDIIDRFFSDLTPARADVLSGIGDDCALLQVRSGHVLAVSTDTLVAGRHFLADTDPFKLGHKCLAVNISDLAAMGAEPCWVSLALTLPEVDSDWLQAFSCGFAGLCRQYGLQLVGGDTTSGPLSITVTIHGQVKPAEALTRSAAVAGDLICVSGCIGDAALALKLINQQQPIDNVLLDRLLMPQPRVELGMQLAGVGAACIDISDGLLQDLGHICKASACQAVIELEKLPLSTAMKSYIDETGSWELPLSGGDDYELCFSISPDSLLQLRAGSDMDITIVGEVRAGAGVVCLDASGLPVTVNNTGFMHFHD